MKYNVYYTGNNSKFKHFVEESVTAKSEREAVEKVYKSQLPANYFPQDDGSILDNDGVVISMPADDSIDYDGGYFVAEIS